MFEKRLFGLVPEATPLIIASVACKWVALVANVCVMWLLATLVAGALEGTALSLAPHAIWLALAIAVRAVAIYLAQRVGDRAAFVAVRRIRQLVYGKLSSMGPSYAEHVGTAEAVQTSVEGAQQLQVYFGGYLPQLFYSALAPVTLFGCLVWQAGLPAALLLACVPLIPISIMAVMRNAKRIGEEYWGSYVDLGGMFLEAVQGLTTLKIYRADAGWHKRINEESERFRGATMRLLMMQLRSICVMDLVVYVGAALGIIVAVAQLATGAIGFTAAFLTVFLSQEFFLPMRRLGSLFHTAMNGMAASRRMFEILDTPEPVRGNAELDGHGDVELAEVGYAYGEKVVLEGVSGRLRAGSLVAVVGESGGGKSTLAGILSGRKDGYLGSVRIGGSELRDATAASLMRAVTLVPTNGHLFAGTLRENLLLARPDASEGELWEALAKARVDAFVRSSGGLDLPLVEGGSNLSGGQRQRVVIARALLHDSPVYVFDEATSNVDVDSERAINEVISGLAGEHTVLVIAHRLAAVTGADDILVLEHGQLVQRGTHAELMAQDGPYRAMYESQESLASFMGSDDVASHVESGRTGHEGAADMPFGASSPGGAGLRESAGGQIRGASAKGTNRSGFSIMMRMMGLVRPLAPWLGLAIVLGSVGMFAATFVIAFGAFGLAAASGEGVGLTVLTACVLCGVCGVVRGPLHYGEQLCNHYIAFRLLAHVRDLVFGALRRLAPAKLEGRGKGDLVSLVTSDIELLEVFYAHTISPIAIALVCSAVMLGFLGWMSPTLAVVALIGYLVVGVALPLVSNALCGSAGRASRDAVGRMGAYVLDGLRGLSETVQFGRVAERERGLDELTDEVGAVDTRLQRRAAAFEALADVCVLVLSLVMLHVAFGLAADGSIGFGGAFVATFAFFSSFGPVLAVSRLGASLQGTLASGARVLDLLDEQPQTPDVTDGVDVSFSGASCEHVGFSYDGSPAGEVILEDVSLDFPVGQVTCVAGASGSGKSTLLKLLMRFWDASSGVVRVSGEDVRRVNTESLRACEAYMTQDTHLFVGTLADNLRVARADATDAELDEAVRAASLEGLMARLPKGYDTPVGELGDTLSGGERQRIGLARVFLSGAPFVLLDEPTSSLDALNEAAVMRAIAARREGRTIVLVSHRASTCAFADRFYSVEHGRLS